MAELYQKLNQSLERNKPTRETEAILKIESTINALDDKGYALLHYIAEGNNIALIKIIIEKRKDLNFNIISNPGSMKQGTALLKSIESKNMKISKILINSGADVNLGDYFRITPLLASIRSSNTELAVILINSGALFINLTDIHKNSPLIALASMRNSNAELGNLLINSGADINISNCDKNSALTRSITTGNTELAKILINSGADIHLRDWAQRTPLHYAVLQKNVQVATALLQHNPNINAQDSSGKTPLITLSRCDNYDFRSDIILDLLLSHRADVNIFDYYLQSPLNNLALISEEAVNKMLSHNPRFDALDFNGYLTIFIFFKNFNNEDIILRVIEQGCCVRQTDPNDASVLHYAVDSDYKRVAYKLLSDGFDLNCRDSEGNTSLHKASSEDIEILCTLLYYGADPNLLNNDNTSPLLNAIRAGNHKLVDLLFLSYEGLNGDDCHKVVYAILEKSLENPLDVPNTVVEMLAKFENFFENRKEEFKRYGWYAKYKYSDAILKRFLDLSAKIKSIALVEYMSFHCEDYYSKLISLRVKNPSLKKDILSLVWFSLSLGITCSYRDFHDSSSIARILFDEELLALMWGSHSLQLLSKRHGSYTFHDFFGIYYNLLHSDIGSMEGKTLLSILIIFNNHIMLGESVYNANIIKILSFFTTEECIRCAVTKASVAFGAMGSCYDLPISVKKLAELSRDTARVFIMQKYKTTNFYQLHEVVNNLDIPNRVKRLLQFRIPVNCVKRQV